jgi:hypothetical protein
MPYKHIRPNQLYRAYFKAHEGRQVKRITEAVAADAIAGCPIDSGDLVETIGTRYPGQLVGLVTVGGQFAKHWAAVEYGARPHLIESHGRWSLHNVEEDEYYGRVVHHPGNTAQPYMRPALYRRRRLVAI